MLKHSLIHSPEKSYVSTGDIIISKMNLVVFTTQNEVVVEVLQILGKKYNYNII